MEAKAIVKNYMESQIRDLKDGMHNLQGRRDEPPTQTGNLYNGILKHAVSFEIERMELMRDELMALL